MNFPLREKTNEEVDEKQHVRQSTFFVLFLELKYEGVSPDVAVDAAIRLYEVIINS
jgi:hypothetical protein